MDYGIIYENGSMLPEYGICMSLVRSTSAALDICDVRCTTSCNQSESGSKEPTVDDDGDTVSDGRQRWTDSRKQLTVNDIVDILCYVWYLPLFFAGPLVTYSNFLRQVCTLLVVITG